MTEQLDYTQTLHEITSGSRILFENPWQNPEAFQNGLTQAREYLDKHQAGIIAGNQFHSDNIYWHTNPNAIVNNSEADTFGPISVTPYEGIETALECASSENKNWSNPELAHERIAVFDKFGALLNENRFALYGLMALSQGKNGIEIWRDSQELMDFVTEYRKYPQFLEFMNSNLRSGGKTEQKAVPAGVVGVWAPFNFTCIGMGETIAALAAGNSVILHASPRNIGPYAYLTEMLYKAGVPEDRLQFIIPDPQDPKLSKGLARDPRVNQISFTGSHAVALQMDAIMSEKRHATGRLDYRVDSETGGRNPIIMASLPPEGLDYAVERIVDSMTGYQGQKCSALSELLIVGEELGIEITSTLVEKLQQLNVLPTTIQESDMGALIDSKATQTVMNQIGAVKREGATILTGGTTHPDLPGAVLPTLYQDLPENSSLKNIEIFGPVAQVRIVKNTQEAIERANGMGFALTAGVMSEDIHEASTIASQLHHGVTYVNDGCTAAPVPQMPFGGAHFSGTGTLLKPGSSGHPLQFTRMRSVASLPRKDW